MPTISLNVYMKPELKKSIMSRMDMEIKICLLSTLI